MIRCNKECSLSKTLFSQQELDFAKNQFPNYDVVTAEKIKHKDYGTKIIDSRAIIYSPVGNQVDFWDVSGEQISIPKIAIIGFSTSLKAMEDFYKNSQKMDIDIACKISAFGGALQLRKHLKLVAKFLNFEKYLGKDFKSEKMFESYQKDIFYTQIIKCCSLGKIDKFSKSTAIYPNKIVDKNIKSNYLNNSGHRECIEKIFLNEMRFSKPVPLILIFKPAWDNLKEMGLVSKLNGNIIDWIPHPSNPGNDVIKLLNLENAKDIDKYDCKKSGQQLKKIREKINDLI
ncbi:MAG: hypothetical protein C5S44_02505 [Candidatus Methanocomedens sp.]|jgi:hypothetical protein|nr:MAG: hypothetical protein C5S44_02505 [ANME-2 cluster archaeon]